MKKKVNYLANKRLLAQLEECHRQERMTEEFGASMMLLVERISRKPNFAYYSYLDEMRGDALVLITNAWHKFNAERSQNPFAYFSQITMNAFVAYLKKEKKHQDKRDALLVDAGMACSFSYDEKMREAQRVKSKR